jgi:hypothetical protein
MEKFLRPGRHRCMFILAFACGSAHAHGEEVLVSVYAQLVSIAACALVLFTWRRALAHRVTGLLACVGSIVVEQWAISGLPYMQYRTLITAAGFIVPLAATVSAICLAHWVRELRQRPPTLPDRS